MTTEQNPAAPLDGMPHLNGRPAGGSTQSVGVEHPIGALNERMGIQLIEATAQRVVATMPVAGNTQPYGLLHGGASVVLAETLGSVGSAIHAHPDRLAVGVDINATHHRSAREGVVTGTATAIHLGRTTTCYEVVIADEQGRRLCTARITCALVPDRNAGGTAAD